MDVDTMRSIFAGLALLVCPAAYMTLCVKMKKAGVPNSPNIPFLFLFGTIGGWMLAISLSPSGLAAMSVIFLGTVAPIALLATSIRLVIRPERTAYHRVAIWSRFTYPSLLVFWMLIVVIIEK